MKITTREIKFRDYEPELNQMRYFDLDSYDREEHDSYGNIMQYSGVRDKSGRDIYENDIVKSFSIDDGEMIEVVEFSNGQFLLSNPNKLSWPVGDYKTDFLEIIGNVHENPELL